MRVTEIALDAIDPSPYQPRRTFGETALRELADSIRQHGVQQPIVVRPRGARYEVVMGERRVRASRLAGKATVPAQVKAFSDQEAAELALIENLQRVDLSPLEECAAYRALLDRGLGVRELAARIGRTETYIHYRLALERLDPVVREALRTQQINLVQAWRLARLTPAQQRPVIARVLQNRATGDRVLADAVSAVLEVEMAPHLFESPQERAAVDADRARRFLAEIDHVSARVARWFQPDEPAPADWLLTQDPAPILARLEVLGSSIRLLIAACKRANARRAALEDRKAVRRAH